MIKMAPLDRLEMNTWRTRARCPSDLSTVTAFSFREGRYWPGQHAGSTSADCPERAGDDRSVDLVCQHEACQNLSVGMKPGELGARELCEAHGGRRTCMRVGCALLVFNRTLYCATHGGTRYLLPVCHKVTSGTTGPHCKRHGGDTLCQYAGYICSKVSLGDTNLCSIHGGGDNRCQHRGCHKFSLGDTTCCKAHGGGKKLTQSTSTNSVISSTTSQVIAHLVARQRKARYESGQPSSLLANLHEEEGVASSQLATFAGDERGINITPTSTSTGGRMMLSGTQAVPEEMEQMQSCRKAVKGVGSSALGTPYTQGVVRATALMQIQVKYR